MIVVKSGSFTGFLFMSDHVCDLLGAQSLCSAYYESRRPYADLDPSAGSGPVSGSLHSCFLLVHSTFYLYFQ